MGARGLRSHSPLRSSFLGPLPLPSSQLAPMAIRITQRPVIGSCIPPALIARVSAPYVTRGLPGDRSVPARNAQVRPAMQVAELAYHVPIGGVLQDPPITTGAMLVPTSYDRNGQAPPRSVLGLNPARRASPDLRTVPPIGSRVGPPRPRPYPVK